MAGRAGRGCRIVEKGFCTKAYRKVVLFSQKSPTISWNFRKLTGERDLGIPHSGSLSQERLDTMLLIEHLKEKAGKREGGWASREWKEQFMHGFYYYYFNNLRFNKSQNINELSAADVFISFVSSELLRCRLLKRSLYHPMSNASDRVRSWLPRSGWVAENCCSRLWLILAGPRLMLGLATPMTALRRPWGTMRAK